MLCDAAGINLVNTFALESRYQTYLATQLLCKGLFGTGVLRYHPTGKPYIDQLRKVSISHSGNLVVMMRSVDECGVDLEKIHSRVQKVSHKFLNDEELERVNGAPVETLVRYWCAKEAMFKVYGSQDVFMRSNIFVDDVTEAGAKAVLIDGDLRIPRTIKFHTLDGMMLAWTEVCDEE